MAIPQIEPFQASKASSQVVPWILESGKVTSSHQVAVEKAAVNPPVFGEEMGQDVEAVTDGQGLDAEPDSWTSCQRRTFYGRGCGFRLFGKVLGWAVIPSSGQGCLG